MPVNHEAEDYLNYYCALPAAEFAIMINGPWGSGKTYFIKKYLETRTQSLQDNGQSFHYFYVSLYGIRSVSEITDQFFAQAQPHLNSKAARLLGSAASRLVNIFLQGEILSEKEDPSAIKDIFLKLDGRVLIFDDLERCAMPLNDVIGFINAYVEHDGHKVIVIANEDEIPIKQRPFYKNKKEKLVGKTLQVLSDPSEVLDSFIGRVKKSEIRNVLDNNKDDIFRIFSFSKRHNFRSLRFVLSDYDRLVSKLDPRLQEKPEAMSKLLLFMMAVGMEYRSGDLTATEIANFGETERSRFKYQITKQEKTKDVIKLESLETTYPNVDWTDSVVPLAALGKLFDTGMIDTMQINEHLAEHPLIVGYAETPAWRQMWSWIELPRTQYLKARAQLVAELYGRKLTHPGVILHAAGIVISVRDRDDHLIDDSEVVEFFEHYLDDVHAAGKLEPARDLFGWRDSAYANLGYQCEDSSDFRKIKDIVKAATFKSFEDRMQSVASSYIERIKREPDFYSSLYEYGVESGNYGDAPFLHYIDPKVFAGMIIKDSMLDGRLLASLHKRYEHEINQGALLAVEYPWLKVVQSLLEASAAASQPPHKGLLEIRIKYYFDKLGDAIYKAEGEASA